jgi:predicted nuclease of predicted toxin-antitoxin system
VNIWLDEQLSPAVARWASRQFDVTAQPVRELGLKSASDEETFFAARAADAVVITKDQDFVRLLERHGPPPKVICVTCGNTSNARLQEVLSSALPKALALFSKGESLVEIRDAL